MFATKTTDEQQLRKVVADDAADRKKLERMERDLEALRPKWLEVQERIEQLCAQYGANDRSYLRGVHETFWRDREESLRTEIDRLAAARDNLTASLPAAITALKAKIHNRQSLVAGDFSSWAVQISHRLPQPLAAEIESARTTISGLGDLGKIVAAIQDWIGRIAALDAGPALMNLGGTVRRLAD